MACALAQAQRRRNFRSTGCESLARLPSMVPRGILQVACAVYPPSNLAAVFVGADLITLLAEEAIQKILDYTKRRRLATPRPASQHVAQLREILFERRWLEHSVKDPLVLHLLLQPPGPVHVGSPLLDVQLARALDVQQA